MLVSLGGGAGESARIRERRQRSCAEQRVTERFGGGRCSLAPVAHLLVLHAVVAVDDELQHQRYRIGRVMVVESIESAHEPTMRLLVVAEQMLDSSTGGHQLRAQGGGLLRYQRDAGDQG